MKLGIFTVSTPDYTPEEALDKIKEIGYDGVEWRVTTDTGDKSTPSFWSGNRTSMTAEELIEKAPKLIEQMNSLGLECPSICPYICCGDLDQVDLHLKAAQAIGAKVARISPGGYNPDNGTYPELVDRAKSQYEKVAKIAEKYEVRAVIETHMGQLGPSITKAKNIIQHLDPKHVGIMWDPGNQVTEGGEVYQMAIEEAGEYLAEVQIKNAAWSKSSEDDEQTLWQGGAAPIRHGVVNWPAVVEALKAANYEGWLFFEDFCTDLPLEERLVDNLAWFRKLLA